MELEEEPPLPAQLPLPRRHEAQGGAGEGCKKREEEVSVQVHPPGSDQQRPHSKCSIKTSAMKKQQWVVVRGGNSFLKGTEVPICRPDPLHRKVCCLPGAQIRKLLSIIQPSEYNPLLFQMSANDRATGSLRPIKRDFRALGRQLKDSGAQIVFSSIPPVMGRG